ncbi:MAG: NAD(P)H-hydrate dehydratase [Clostridiales bacterium]|nr:NAD(P)H-hydrate dehydratase [Clostridiales bacterium]
MIQITTSYVENIITARPKDMHKGQAGRVLFITGSKGMAGAAVLSARGALYSGAGLVKVSVPDELFPILQISVPEAMCISREEAAKADLGVYDAICIGPGLGVSEGSTRLINRVIADYSGPLVIDADGINCLCEYDVNIEVFEQIRNREGATVFTPHPGEADRMLGAFGLESWRVMGRETAAALLAEKTESIVLLKGAPTIIASGGELFENPTGNPGMATGGSGDVLSGIITSLLAQKQLTASAVDRVCAAAFLHGLAGDIAAENIGEYGMTSADIADAVAAAFNAL